MPLCAAVLVEIPVHKELCPACGKGEREYESIKLDLRFGLGQEWRKRGWLIHGWLIWWLRAFGVKVIELSPAEDHRRSTTRTLIFCLFNRGVDWFCIKGSEFMVRAIASETAAILVEEFALRWVEGVLVYGKSNVRFGVGHSGGVA